jgi:hypothetical protein
MTHVHQNQDGTLAGSAHYPKKKPHDRVRVEPLLMASITFVEAVVMIPRGDECGIKLWQDRALVTGKSSNPNVAESAMHKWGYVVPFRSSERNGRRTSFTVVDSLDEN